ncbi:hypothetical protein Tco_0859126 [Tanacetum coccineum]|uniref:Uncharacterized protein n=1 Tax=Tanacetum coccineum TaxID=301880 RepID=A0ABQ5BGR8_9ASTR
MEKEVGRWRLGLMILEEEKWKLEIMVAMMQEEDPYLEESVKEALGRGGRSGKQEFNGIDFDCQRCGVFGWLGRVAVKNLLLLIEGPFDSQWVVKGDYKEGITMSADSAITYTSVHSELRLRALEARVVVLETQANRHEWQRQGADDHAVEHIMRTQALEARARIDTLEDTGSSS